MCECDDEFSKYVAELAIITATDSCAEYRFSFIHRLQARAVIPLRAVFWGTPYRSNCADRCYCSSDRATYIHSVAKFYPDLLIPDNLNLRIVIYILENLHIFSPISKKLYSYNHGS